MTRYIRGFSHFVTSMTAPIASGWSKIAGWDLHPLENAAFARRTPEHDLHQAVESFKHRHIVSILEDTKGDPSKAAELLGISPATLFLYIDKYGLKDYALKKHGRLH